MDTVLIIITAILATASVAALFISGRYAVVLAFFSLLLGGASGYVTFSPGVYAFWFAAAAIVMAINYLLPKQVVTSTFGTGYITAASLAGMFVGLCMGHAAMIIATVAGALIGSIAFILTPAGRQLGFPSQKAVNYLCAKSFPCIVSLCIIGTFIFAIISAGS